MNKLSVIFLGTFISLNLQVHKAEGREIEKIVGEIKDKLKKETFFSCYVKTEVKMDAFLSRRFYDFQDFGLRYSDKKQESIVLIDPKGRFQKGLLQNLDEIIQIDDCLVRFHEYDYLYIDYLLIPKIQYILMKNPKELSGKIHTVIIKRKGKLIKYSIDDYLKNHLDLFDSYKPFPEVDNWKKIDHLDLDAKMYFNQQIFRMKA